MNKPIIRMGLSLGYMIFSFLLIIGIILHGIFTDIHRVPFDMMQFGFFPVILGVVISSVNLKDYGHQSLDWPIIHFLGSLLALFIALFSFLIIYF